MDTSKPNIQVLKPHYRVEECLDEIRQCLEKGWTGLGFKTTEFEEAWKTYTGLPNAHFVCSATAGLHLATNILKSFYGWKDGDEIISTSLTFVSTNHAILYEGLKPVFADVDSDTLCLDPLDVEKKITSKTRAVMYVGLGGRYGHLKEISDLCKKYGLRLILDAAHMAGTRCLGEHVGREADVTVFSFQSVKNLPTADGGMICFKDQELDARARKMSWLGIDKDTYARSQQNGTYKWKYDVPYLGFKYHGNSIMAAIGLVQLKWLDQDNHRRREIADIYDDELLREKLWTPIDLHGAQQSSHIYQIVVDNRDNVLNLLNERGIYPGVHYVDNTNYSMYRYGYDDSRFAHMVSQKLLSLPIHLEMTDEDVKRVASAVNEVVTL
jgi:dTDP-4-amino-4,6-dideoxygalactose transaminase